MATPYIKIGDGDHPVLVLNGWLGSAGAWAPLWPCLDRTRFRYFFLDYRGYGARKDVEGAHTIEEAANDVLAAADELGIGRFSVIGHSMGGMVVQRVLVEAPGRVRALAGISPVPASGAPMEGGEWELFAGAADNPGNRRAIIDFTTGSRLTAVWLDAMVRHSLDNSTRQAFAGYLRAFSRTDFHERVIGCTTPVLALAGRYDPAMSLDVMKRTFAAWYRCARLVELPGVGHYAMDEQPVLLATEIEKF